MDVTKRPCIAYQHRLITALFVGASLILPVHSSHAKKRSEEVSSLYSKKKNSTSVFKRFGRSLVQNIAEPEAWVPLTSAALFSLGNFDLKISNWMREQNPLFGSQPNARKMGDVLRNILMLQAFTTTLFVEEGKEGPSWALSKGKRLFIQTLGLASVVFLGRTLKSSTNRQRPNGVGEDSFPSEHSSTSFALSAITRNNLEQIHLASGWQTGLSMSSLGLATSVAWARMEAGRHFPSDVLFGAFLGNFLSNTIQDTFLQKSDYSIMILPSRDGLTTFFNLGF